VPSQQSGQGEILHGAGDDLTLNGNVNLGTVARTITIYLLQQDPENPAATHSAGATFTCACFPGLSISAREVFER